MSDDLYKLIDSQIENEVEAEAKLIEQEKNDEILKNEDVLIGSSSEPNNNYHSML